MHEVGVNAHQPPWRYARCARGPLSHKLPPPPMGTSQSPVSAVPPLNALKRTPLLHQIQEEIKSYVIRNNLKPGDALPSEGDLARQLGIGRNSVREAVKSLEVLGILEARAGSGLFVKAFTFDAIINNLPYGLLSEVKTVRDMAEV